MSEFQKKDKVMLISGGPVMVVADVADYGPVGPEDGVKCVWMDAVKGVNTPKEHVFDAVVLEKWESPTAGIFTV